MKQKLIWLCLFSLGLVWCFPVAAQHFELPQAPAKKVKHHPLEKAWMEQGLQLRIHISSLSVRYGDNHPVMVQQVKRYVALIQELKRLRFLLKQKVKVEGFLVALLNQSLQMEMKLAQYRVVYHAKHPKLKELSLQRKLLKARLRGWLQMQKYSGPLYPPPRKPAKRK